MATVGYINFIADSPLWEKEKPFGVTLPSDYEPLENHPLTNLLFDERRLEIHDMRQSLNDFSIETSGFTLLQQPTKYPEIENMVIFEQYKKETEGVLHDLLRPEFVVCWDARVST